MDEQRDRILTAAASHDVGELQKLLDQYTFPDCSSVDVLDPSTKRCPLHFAIASSATTNGSIKNGPTENLSLDSAEATVHLLLENGAIWNQLDYIDETPGCLALRLNLDSLYQLMVDAGVRAEFLLNKLDGYEELDDEESEETEVDGEEEAPALIDSLQTDTSSTEAQTSAASAIDVSSEQYLSSVLSFSKDKLLDDQNNGVMMEWERDIMKYSAEAIVDRHALKVLNIGAGMLIFDSIVQELEAKPSEHHIIEAHPDVLKNLREQGWLDKPGVIVHAGKWQDVLPALVAEGEIYDAIYFDTFAESYNDFKEFFSEQVIGLLSQDGKWSFFNGMGADRQISYDVYQKVAEMDLFEAGFDVEWREIDMPALDKEWEGVKRKYWNITQYRLPVCKFMD